MTTALAKNLAVKGSLAAVAADAGRSLAHSFVNAECVVLVDTSSSMNAPDAPGGRSRYAHACAELAALQEAMPGKIAVLSFADYTVFCPGGQPWMLGGGTDVAAALQFAKLADVPGIRFILISDGEPDDPAAALAVARQYQSRIDTIFVGAEAAQGGRKFLTRLSAISGGQSLSADRAAQLADTARRLLTATEFAGGSAAGSAAA